MKSFYDKFIHKITCGGNMGVAALWVVFVSALLILSGSALVAFGLYKMGQEAGWW